MGANNLFGIPKKFAVTPSEIRLWGARGTGTGSGNTSIKTFNTTTVNTGDAITYQKNDVNGDAFLIHHTAVYAVIYTDCGTAASNDYFAITVNELPATMSGSPTSTPDSQILDIGFGITSATGGSTPSSVSLCYIGILYANDVVRAHPTGTSAETTDQKVHFQICKISGTYGI